MKAVVQRVTAASVLVDGHTVGEIGLGFMVLVGVAAADDGADVEWVADKIAGLRVFDDGTGKMNMALGDVGGAVLLVSQFTLLADTRKGRRPSFVAAAGPEQADVLYRQVADALRGAGIQVQTGSFGAHMAVELTGDGPVTIVLDSADRERAR